MRQVCLQRDTSCSLYSHLLLSNFYSYTLSYSWWAFPLPWSHLQDFPSFSQPMRVRFFHKIRSIKEAGIRSSWQIPYRIFTTEREKERERELMFCKFDRIIRLLPEISSLPYNRDWIPCNMQRYHSRKRVVVLKVVVLSLSFGYSDNLHDSTREWIELCDA